MPSTRRDLILGTSSALGLLGLAKTGFGNSVLNFEGLKNYGPLQSPNNLGLRLPQGISARLVAESGTNVSTVSGRSGYTWHRAPDGGACFPTEDGGWIYTSNSEVRSDGGAGSLRFDRSGNIIDAYSILEGTRNNCAGGPTPWQTWLSCEEVDRGMVYECDIYGQKTAISRPALGSFKHEAVAVDPDEGCIYLTEDERDGLFYKFIPDNIRNGKFDLSSGQLRAAVVSDDGFVEWRVIPFPNPSSGQAVTRRQLRNATRFNGGEGIWYHNQKVYFVTKGDNRVWSYDTAGQFLSVIYDRRTSPKPILSGVDNVTVSQSGHVLIAEDGGDMQIVVLGPTGDIYPLVQVEGQGFSELAGIAITPDNKRLYFSSQRGGRRRGGLTYELTGDFQ
ncbi:MAG: DUF839 domain-containing protein [Pseudobacteriovorax sp.]|nr:DUF839 domain-containing protein [Pseudobacteriovorax sp.]